jgi:predicted DNA-binding antitoxin AbrB/MazE fold protein
VFKKTIILSILGAFMFQAIIFNGCLYTFSLLAKFEEKIGNAQWISFSEQQYDKLKLNETEFLYNNNMYDIISFKTENGIIKLLCKVDAKEKDFLERLIEGFKQSKAKRYIAFIFVGDIIKSFQFLIDIKITDNIKHFYFSSAIQQNSLERIIPPPKA